MRFLISLAVSVCALALVTTTPGQESPANPPTPHLEIQLDPSSLAIRGVISSEGHRAILSRTAAGFFSEQALDLTVAVRPALPPGWALTTKLALQSLASMRSATADISPDHIDITGVTVDGAAWLQAAQAINQALLPGMTFAHRVEDIGSSVSLEDQCRAHFEMATESATIEFAQSAATLGTAAYPLLDELIQIAFDCPTASILVTGHTDRTGEESTNIALSQARADAVADYLIAGGIHDGRIEARGAGSKMPLAEGSGARIRRMNRRIEVDLRFE